MISVLPLTIVLQAAGARPESDFVLISYIAVHAKKLNQNEIAIAQRYASCISRPYFPLPAEFSSKRDKCRSNLELRKPPARLVKALDRLDRIVREYPGSEASLRITRE